MLAILSDIHANREALTAVLLALREMAPDRVVCLGDIVGYGPDPVWCVEAVQASCDVTLCGNHDFALVHGARDFTPQAEGAVNYHRQLLMPRFSTPEDRRQVAQQRWDYLKELPHRHVEDQFLFVHAAPRNPVTEYLSERDVRMGLTRKLGENFELVEWLCFIGHTHCPAVITADMKFLRPEQLDCRYRTEPGSKAIINVGSVGQPRDGDWRACFVTVEGREVTFHRVPYDIEATTAKIDTSGVLDLELSDRLREGV